MLCTCSQRESSARSFIASVCVYIYIFTPSVQSSGARLHLPRKAIDRYAVSECLKFWLSVLPKSR